MHIEKLTCSSCGSNQLDEIAPGRFQCPYCQASYFIDFDPNTGVLQDARVKGDAQSTQVFAVHGKMTVKGDANRIVLKDSAAARNMISEGGPSASTLSSSKLPHSRRSSFPSLFQFMRTMEARIDIPVDALPVAVELPDSLI